MRFSRAKSSLVACLIILGWVALAVIQAGQPSVLAKDRKANSTSKPQILAAYARLPLRFEANQGQTDSRVQFLSRGNGYSLFLTPTEAVLTLRHPSRDRKGAGRPTNNPQITQITPISPLAFQSVESAKSADETAVLRMKLLGANPAPPATGLDELPGKSNYFIGNDPKQWRTDVPNYGKVRFAGVYPGVDLVYYGNQRQLEYDFVVAPGADPSAIRLGFAGAERLEIDPQGELALETPAGEVRWHKPVVYQEVDGVRQMVDGHYVRQGKEAVGFAVASYDPRRPLIIDPVLVYSTYLGGSSFDVGLGIAVDSSGNAYVTGETRSTTFPTTAGAFQTAFSGGLNDAFVTKLNAAGSALVYSTHLGGSDIGGNAAGHRIAVDSLGNAYVTGQTTSPTFPTTLGAFQTAIGGGAVNAFVTKLNATGSALVYSTFLGGSGGEWGNGIAVDSSGNAYVTGPTFSTNFPTASPIQAASGGGSTDAFVAKLNAAGSALVYSTYLGGSLNDLGLGIAVDSSGNAYVTGTTLSANFPPTLGAFQTALGGGAGNDAFVTKLNPTGSALVYSTFLGGSGNENSIDAFGAGIAADSSGNAYLTGRTSSTNFPTTLGAFQTALGGGAGNDAFVTKLNSTGTGLIYSTFLGGSNDEIGNGIAVDSLGNAYVTGSTQSANFPGTSSSTIQPAFGGVRDVFVTKLNAAGNALVYSTYLGGSGFDEGNGVAVDSTGNAYVTGDTASPFPTTANAYQAVFGGGSSDAFVAKISDAQTTQLTLVKVVTNDNGGTKTLSDFPLSAGGPTPITNQVSGTAGATNVAVDPGTYLLSEVLQPGYTAGAWGCVLTGTATPATMPTATTVSVGLGQNITCTITNNDQPAPPPPPSGISELKDLVESLTQCNRGEKQRLLASLNAAQASIERGNTRAACGQLGAFVHKVKNEKEACVDAETQEEMINLAEALQASLGCR